MWIPPHTAACFCLCCLKLSINNTLSCTPFAICFWVTTLKNNVFYIMGRQNQFESSSFPATHQELLHCYSFTNKSWASFITCHFYYSLLISAASRMQQQKETHFFTLFSVLWLVFPVLSKSVEWNFKIAGEQMKCNWQTYRATVHSHVTTSKGKLKKR